MDVNKEELKLMIDNMTWSYSRINNFVTCPYMWYMTYIKGFKGEQNAFASSGSFVHSILERYAKEELYIWDLLDEFVDNYDEQVPYNFPPNKWVDLGEKNYNAGVEYFSNFEGFDDIGEIVGAEIKVTTDLEDWDCKYQFTGFIDLLLQDKDKEFIIMDHKSKSKFKSKKEQAEYAHQLYIYAKFIKEKYGKFPKMLMFNMFNANDIVKIPFNEKEYNDAIYWCVDIINKIKQETKFEKNVDDFFCNNLCNHRKICSK